MRRVLALVMLSALALGACSSKSSDSTTSASTAASATSAASMAAGTSLQLGAGGALAFAPTTLTAKVGDTLHLDLKNVGSAQHNFSITEFGVNKDMAVGSSARVDVKVTKAGTFQFFCEYHKSLGMVGTLTVT